MSVFKIQNAKGEFAQVGGYSRYTKNGKVWQKIHFLESHLREKNDRDIQRYKQDGCEIVEYEMVEIARYSLDTILETINEKKEIKEAKLKAERESRIRAKELALLKQLQEKYKEN